jgi:gas vesicle protein
MHRQPISHLDTSHTKECFAFFLLGTALGALAAAVVVLLYAPHSGEETRGMIVARSRRLGQRARSGGDEFIHRVREATDEWAAKLQAAADDMVARGALPTEEGDSPMVSGGQN